MDITRTLNHNNFKIRYFGNKIKIYTNSVNDFNKLKADLKQNNKFFHTYTLPADKINKMVLKAAQIWILMKLKMKLKHKVSR